MIKEFKDEYRWLSNFTPVDIELGGQIFPSVEHAFQSMKSSELKWKVFCQKENNPAEIKRRSRELTLSENWHKIKDEIMMKCLRQKFNKLKFKSRLLATEDQEIKEGNWWGDKYWGFDLKTGEGQNKLGKMIMQIREELKQETI